MRVEHKHVGLPVGPSGRFSGPVHRGLGGWLRLDGRQGLWRLKAVPVVTMVVLAGLGAMGSAQAQAQQASMEERLRTQLRATTAQLQQVQNELAALKASGGARGAASTAKPEAAAKESQSQVETLKRELGQARAALAQEREARARDEQQSGATRKTAQETVERSATQVGQFRDAYNEVLRIARTSEAERVRLAAGVELQERALQQCDLKNRELYRVGQEILEAYESLDTRTVLESRHLFAAKVRVKYDEVAQRFGDRLYAGKFDPANPQGVGAGQAAEPSQAQPQGQAPVQRPTTSEGR